MDCRFNREDFSKSVMWVFFLFCLESVLRHWNKLESSWHDVCNGK